MVLVVLVVGACGACGAGGACGACDVRDRMISAWPSGLECSLLEDFWSVALLLGVVLEIVEIMC